MATGRPLIANGRPEIIDRITSEASPILQATTPQHVAAHLEALVASREYRETIGRQSRAYVERHFSADVAANVFLEAFTPGAKPVSDPLPVRAARWRHPAVLWFLKFGLTAAVMVFVFTRIVDWPSLSRAATGFPLSALGVVFALHLVHRWVVAWQTRLALAHAGIALSTPRVFQIHLITSFFSVVLPGEVAGAAVSWHLFSRDSGRRAQTAAALIYLRLIGFFMLVLMGSLGLFFEPRLLALHAHWTLLAAGLVVGLPLLSFHSLHVARSLKRISDAITGSLPWNRLRSAFVSFWTSVHDFTAISRTTQAAIWVGACANYLLNVGGCLVAMHAAQIQVPDIAVVWLLALVAILSLVPFTLAGFGVRELGVAMLLKQWYGVPTESAVLLSLALGAVGLIASAGLGGLAFLPEVLKVRGPRTGEAPEPLRR